MALCRRRHRHLVLTARAARLGRFARMRFPRLGVNQPFTARDVHVYLTRAGRGTPLCYW